MRDLKKEQSITESIHWAEYFGELQFAPLNHTQLAINNGTNPLAGL